MGPEEDPIREAREAADAVRGLLLAGTPDAMISGIPLLETAVGRLEALKKGVEAGTIGGKPVAESLAALRPTISRITSLIRN
jgi:hypothetical protein